MRLPSTSTPQCLFVLSHPSETVLRGWVTGHCNLGQGASLTLTGRCIKFSGVYNRVVDVQTTRMVIEVEGTPMADGAEGWAPMKLWVSVPHAHITFHWTEWLRVLPYMVAPRRCPDTLSMDLPGTSQEIPAWFKNSHVLTSIKVMSLQVTITGFFITQFICETADICLVESSSGFLRNMLHVLVRCHRHMVTGPAHPFTSPLQQVAQKRHLQPTRKGEGRIRKGEARCDRCER